MVFWRFGGKWWLNKLISESVTEVIVEQPQLHQVCLIYLLSTFLAQLCSAAQITLIVVYCVHLECLQPRNTLLLFRIKATTAQQELHCTLKHCTVLNCTVIYCTVLFGISKCYVALFYTVFHCLAPYCIVGIPNQRKTLGWNKAGTFLNGSII